MPKISRQALRVFLRSGCLLVVLIGILFSLRFIPGGSHVFHDAAQYILLLGSSASLLLLGLAAMYPMYKAKDYTSLGRSIFGFLCGLLLGLFVEGLIRDPKLIATVFKDTSTLGIYARSFGAGAVLSEIGTLTRRHGNPFLVFLCSSIAWVMIELLTIPDIGLDLNWLIAFLLGIGVHQMFRFRSRFERRVRSVPNGDQHE